jgi:hypothetical protein
MEIGKPPVIDGAHGAGPAPGAQSATVKQGAAPPTAVDRADIRPLSVTAALQILITEVVDQLSLLTLPAPAPALAPAQGQPDSPDDAALRLVNLFLQSLPASDEDAQGFLAAYDIQRAGLELGIERALGVVVAWRDVPRESVDALGTARTMVLTALADDAPGATLGPWAMRTEWLALAPRIDLLRRRRRRARRRQLDPDLPLPDIDDEHHA